MRRLLAITNRCRKLYEALKYCSDYYVVKYISEINLDNAEQIVREIEVEYRLIYDDIIIYETNNILIEKIMFLLFREKIINIYIVKEYYVEKNLLLSKNDYFNKNACYYISDWNKPYIAHIETHINDYCNLNCKACNNYAPFFSKGCIASLDSFINDLINLNKLFIIGRLYLLGGEPLLEPELVIRFIETARKILPDVEIRLITNGLLIPQMTKVFWNCIRENNIILRISRYIPTSQIIDNIKDRLKKEKIKNVISDEITTFIKKQTIKKMEDKELSNRLCGSAGCHYFRDGYIVKCPDAVLVKKFDDFFGTNICQNDGMKIVAIKEVGKVIEQLIAPCKMCATCGIERAEYINWQPNNGSLQKESWIIDDKLVYMENKVKNLERKLVIKRTLDILNIISGIEYTEFSVVCFGGGNCFQKNKDLIRNYIDIKFICDNYLNSAYIDGIKVISIRELLVLQNPFIIITIENSIYIKEIEKQLQEMGLYRYMLVHDFLNKCLCL